MCKIKIIKALALSFILSLTLTIPLVYISHTGGPYSYAIYDKDKLLLGAQVAKDGQWRFSPSEVPDKFKKAIITFEDKRFYFHCGIDTISIYRALISNIKAKKIVSGASTITMQTARILEGNKKRTLQQKAKEAILAIFYELLYHKKGVLELYVANAPFGGNVVGLEAASWRYFNRPPHSLTWAEVATLAVLPNQPSLVYPGANKEILKSKRDRLLKDLYKRKYIDENTLYLSLEEIIPEKPYALAQSAPHYFERLKETNKKESKFYTTINAQLQKNVINILNRWSNQFSRNGINNGAAIIIETKTGNVLSYCGNTQNEYNTETQDVDILNSKRSSGSLLKPFLYAAMLDAGMLLPEQLVIDIPTRIGNYKPDNNIPTYRGAVPASEALSRSLNIPAVRELREYGITAFLDYLKKCGFTTFTRNSDNYGLTLILGGGEVTLEETVIAYANIMNRANESEIIKTKTFPMSSGSAYLTLVALAEGIRPDDEEAWQSYANAKRIAWKTGTSNGNRDAWAIGVTNEYTVGVWIGNAEGQGKADLKSITTAAPVMFDLFSILPGTSWPAAPYDNLQFETVCANSGYKAGSYCTQKKKILRSLDAPESAVCPYCTSVSLTPDGKYRASVQDLKGEYEGKLPKIENYFVLPPAIEYWYTRSSLGYRTLPPYIETRTNIQQELLIVFPEHEATIVLPIEIDGTKGKMVMQAVNRDKNATIYWDIDGEYLGSTTTIHEIAVRPNVGNHVLTITDSRGNRQVRTFKIVSEK